MSAEKKQIKFMMINPPQRYFGESLGFNVYFPLGILSNAANIRDLCDVRILDCLVEDFEIDAQSNFSLYGTPEEKIRQKIIDFNPDIVGITIPFSAQSLQGRRLGDLCREIDPKITVIMGGPHPSVRFKQLLEDNVCDYCAHSEGEITIREIVEIAIEKSDEFQHLDELEFHKKVRETLNVCGAFNIPGLSYLKEGKLIYMPRAGLKNLDELPMPAYDMINMNDYLDSPYLYRSRSTIGEKSISMITSRGCPYKCTFCSINLHMGHTYRYNSPENVLDHLTYCVEVLGIRNFHFEDDNLSLHRRRFEKILDGIIERDLQISWDTPNGIRADSLNLRVVKKMKQAGAKCLQIAIESGNQEVLNGIIKKESEISSYIDVAKWCHDVGIRLGAFYVIGFPGETLDNMKDTTGLAMRLFKEFNVYPILLFATPLYGTELYNVSVEEGLIEESFTDEDIAQATQFYGQPLIATKDFSKEDLKKIAMDFQRDLDALTGQEGSLRKVLRDKNSLFDEDGKMTGEAV